MNYFFKHQAEVVVNGLMKLDGFDRTTAIQTWMNSETKRLIQDKYKFEHISGARCYDELKMELEKDPFWMHGSFD
jgi:hypothetical protein